MGIWRVSTHQPQMLSSLYCSCCCWLQVRNDWEPGTAVDGQVGQLLFLVTLRYCSSDLVSFYYKSHFFDSSSLGFSAKETVFLPVLWWYLSLVVAVIPRLPYLVSRPSL